jgi:hypothetical protein
MSGHKDRVVVGCKELDIFHSFLNGTASHKCVSRNLVLSGRSGGIDDRKR